MRGVWASDLAGDRYLLHGCPKCDRSETLGDGFRLVTLLPVLAPEGGQHARVIAERDRALVVEAQRRERLDGVEEELLGLRELAAVHSAHPMRLLEKSVTARVTGTLDDRVDPLLERLVVDPPARRGEYRERTDQGLVDESLRVAGAAYGVVARLALAHPVDRGDEVARGEVERARLGLDELFAEGLLVGRAHRSGGRGGHRQRGVRLARRQEELAARRGRKHSRKVP